MDYARPAASVERVTVPRPRAAAAPAPPRATRQRAPRFASRVAKNSTLP